MSPRPRVQAELLAPAGDFISLQAAIDAGADAIYVGLGKFNMRQGAKNFTLEELPTISERCHAANLFLYLTCNTIVFESEHADVEQLLVCAAPLVDAVICWDPTVMALCRRLQIPIHISTQASVANSLAVRHYQELGAVRIVPARECTLDEVVAIKKKTGMAMELFVHGAMCVSVSGRCFLGQFTTGHSGNRGACDQLCRRTYEVIEKEEGHRFALGDHTVMSAKDLCTLPFIDQLLEAGIDAFKIEGRGRNPDYVFHTVRAYRRAIDLWREGKLTAQKKDELVQQVRTVYHRAFSDGFFLGRPVTSFTKGQGSQATRHKAIVGRVTHYYSRIKVAQLAIHNPPVRANDTLVFHGPLTGVVEQAAKELRQEQTEDGLVGTILVQKKVRVGDRVFKWVDKMES